MLTGGGALAEIIGVKAFALIVLGIAAVQAGMSFFVQGSVVPYRDTAAYIDQNGDAVAGPAGPVTNGTAVEVIPSGPTPDQGQL